MKTGLKPVKRDIRDYSFSKTFGTVSTTVLPKEFSVDAGFPMPDQEADGLPNGCTGYAQADICQDQDLAPYNPKSIYDKTLALEGNAGNYNVGCDIRDSLSVVCKYFGRGSFYALEPLDSWAHAIQSTLFVNQIQRKAISVGTPWCPEFETVGSDGIVPDDFTIPTNWTLGHNWVIPGWTTINGRTMFICKSWQGKRVGKDGILYFSPLAINRLLSSPGSGAFTVSRPMPYTVETVQAKLYEKVFSLCKDIVEALLLKKKV